MKPGQLFQYQVILWPQPLYQRDRSKISSIKNKGGPEFTKQSLFFWIRA